MTEGVHAFNEKFYPIGYFDGTHPFYLKKQ